jgi:YD repeat-containing protein
MSLPRRGGTSNPLTPLSKGGHLDGYRHRAIESKGGISLMVGEAIGIGARLDRRDFSSVGHNTMHTRSILGLSYAILSLSLPACGSSDNSNGNPGPGTGGGQGGSSTSLGTGGQGGSSSSLGTGGSSSPSPTAGCDTWPAAKFIPGYVGVLFYGTQTGPCRITDVEATGTTVELLSYNASGQLDKITRTSTLGGADYRSESTFSWADGVPKTRTYSDQGAVVATSTYQYSSTAVIETYSQSNGSHQYGYTLTPEGYPAMVGYGEFDAATNSFPVTRAGHYEYADCRIVRVCFGTTGEELNACQTNATYQYDAAGRLASVASSSGTSTVTDEYTCN